MSDVVSNTGISIQEHQIFQCTLIFYLTHNVSDLVIQTKIIEVEQNIQNPYTYLRICFIVVLLGSNPPGDQMVSNCVG